MKKIRTIWRMLKCNFKTIVGFELLFKLSSFIIFTPLFMRIFNEIMKINGYTYLTIENVGAFLLKPLTLFMLMILILLMTIYTMFDITTIIIILDRSYHKKKITIKEAIKTSFYKCTKIFHLANIPLSFFILFLIPFLNIGVASSFISTIKIPEFILDFLFQNEQLFYLLIILFLVLTIIFLRWIYALHYFVLEEKSFKNARKKSIKLSKKHHLKDLLSLFSTQFTVVILYFLFIVIGIIIIAWLDDMLSSILLVKSILTTIIWMFIALSFIIITILTLPISYACISFLYYLRKKEKQEEIKEIVIEESNHTKKTTWKKALAIITVIIVIVGTIFTYGLYEGRYDLNIKYIRKIEVTAHRGASKSRPENTMSSFIEAKNLGADWIELDVQQTKDKEIIIIHDTNFKRTTGVDKNTWELSKEEVKELDAGSYFSKEFQNEKVPLLEEVIVFAKENNIKLNIELKPTGHEQEFEKIIVDMIKKHSFEKNCVITSQVYQVLENIKEYDETIETVYVMSLAYGNILSLDKANHFSVEESNVNKNLIDQIHNKGKKLYVWTVNSEENIDKMIDYSVDNIITDNVELVKDKIYRSKTSNVISEYVKWVEKIFKR